MLNCRTDSDFEVERRLTKLMDTSMVTMIILVGSSSKSSKQCSYELAGKVAAICMLFSTGFFRLELFQRVSLRLKHH